MIVLKDKIEYKLSHTIPHNWATLRDSLVALLRGFVLLAKQTITMKKILYVLVFALVLVPSLSFASSLPAGCQVGYKFSVTTGQSCVPPKPQECAPGDIFSYITGERCMVTPPIISDPTQPQPIVTPPTIPDPTPVIVPPAVTPVPNPLFTGSGALWHIVTKAAA